MIPLWLQKLWIIYSKGYALDNLSSLSLFSFILLKLCIFYLFIETISYNLD